MEKGKKWDIVYKEKIAQIKTDELIKILLKNRGIKNSEEIESFLHPKLENVTIDSVDLDKKQLEKSLKRIEKAISKKERIIVFGDYDVDGITGTAILWETLHSMGANVMPYIPHRVEEGYGLSIKGIENILQKMSDCSLIITVDNGIVANNAVAFANDHGIEVIVTDHHAVGEKLPNAFSIVHTTKLCGAGVAYLLSQEIIKDKSGKVAELQSGTVKKEDSGHATTEHLDLVCLGTIADLVPLTNANRILVTFGLEALRNTTRPGLLALFEEAGIDAKNIGTYEIGHIIAPRLNAMGRLESAMDSLRLLCTKDSLRAKVLAEKLGITNRERQLMTFRMTEHAITSVKRKVGRVKNILFIADDSYEQGVIGLIAGRLVETFYRPAIVLAKGEKISKASARSVAGFNIIEFIRKHAHLILEHGGHPMAAGFSVETEKIIMLQDALEKLAGEQLTEDMLRRNLRIDCELPFEMIDQHLYKLIQQLAPFGMNNTEPVFVSRNISLRDMRVIGQEGKHLKLRLGNSITLDAIAFGMGYMYGDLKLGDTVDVAYTIDENTWNGNTKLQLKVKDLKIGNKN